MAAAIDRVMRGGRSTEMEGCTVGSQRCEALLQMRGPPTTLGGWRRGRRPRTDNIGSVIRDRSEDVGPIITDREGVGSLDATYDKHFNGVPSAPKLGRPSRTDTTRPRRVKFPGPLCQANADFGGPLNVHGAVAAGAMCCARAQDASASAASTDPTRSR